MALPVPAWVFSWPVLLIGIGLLTGFKCGFRGGMWFVLILIGSIFLINKIDPSIVSTKYIWPVALIVIGMAFIFRPRNPVCRTGFDNNFQKKSSAVPGSEQPFADQVTEEQFNSKEDIVDATSIFGGIKKNILSKNFKGGDITNIFGGTELNFSQADINGTVVLDITQVFGGTKLIIPSDWDVKSDIVAVFGGVEDGRAVQNMVTNPNKILLLKGNSIFAGIEIKNF
jgi:predicted membrane protein